MWLAGGGCGYTPLVSILFAAASLLFVPFFRCFSFFIYNYIIIICITIIYVLLYYCIIDLLCIIVILYY